jgi:hypothetical protein
VWRLCDGFSFFSIRVFLRPAGKFRRIPIRKIAPPQFLLPPAFHLSCGATELAEGKGHPQTVPPIRPAARRAAAGTPSHWLWVSFLVGSTTFQEKVTRPNPIQVRSVPSHVPSHVVPAQVSSQTPTGSELAVRREASDFCTRVPSRVPSHESRVPSHESRVPSHESRPVPRVPVLSRESGPVPRVRSCPESPVPPRESSPAP